MEQAHQMLQLYVTNFSLPTSAVLHLAISRLQILQVLIKDKYLLHKHTKLVRKEDSCDCQMDIMYLSKTVGASI